MKLSLSLAFLFLINVVWAEQAHRRVVPKTLHERRDELPHEIYAKRDEAKRLIAYPTPYYPYNYPYYPQQQFQCEMCCNGTKFNGLYLYTTSCCGNKIYDSNTAICCGGSNVLPLEPTTTNYGGNYEMQCCGDNSLYNTTAELCCENQIFPKVQLQQCCGNTVYNVTNAISCCGSTVYDSTKQQCYNNKPINRQPGIEPYQCGSATINFKTQICCNGQPVARNGNYTLCCGDQGYKANEQMCCGGTTFTDDKTGTQACCGTQQMNILKQTCCNNVILPSPTGTDCSNYYCCGSELYNSASQTSVCCNDQVNPIPTTTTTTPSPSSGISIIPYYPYPSNNYQCCGSQIYNPQTQTCCGQTTVANSGPNAICCGNVTYDASQKTCCNNMLYDIGKVPLDICCCANGGCNNYYRYPILPLLDK